jgi:hypothetical protein
MATGPVTTALWATGIDLAPGATQLWVNQNLRTGYVQTFVALPFSGPPFQRSLEISRVFHTRRATGELDIYVEVRNIGQEFANYQIFYMIALA